MMFMPPSNLAEVAPNHYIRKDLVLGLWPHPDGSGRTVIYVQGIGLMALNSHSYEVALSLGWADRVPDHIDIGEGKHDDE
jgi:hypothetical protein